MPSSMQQSFARELHLSRTSINKALKPAKFNERMNGKRPTLNKINTLLMYRPNDLRLPMQERLGHDRFIHTFNPPVQPKPCPKNGHLERKRLDSSHDSWQSSSHIFWIRVPDNLSGGFRPTGCLWGERAHSSFLGMVSIGSTRLLGAKKELSL